MHRIDHAEAGVPGGCDGSRGVLLALALVPAVALAAGHWRASGKLHTARYLASATLLRDGRVLVAGGFQSKMLASAEIFDPRPWSVDDGGAVLLRRDSHTRGRCSATARCSSRAGYNFTANYLTSAERYFPASNTWQPAGDMATPRVTTTRRRCCSTDVCWSPVGSTRFGPALTSAELYLPASNRWVARRESPHPSLPPHGDAAERRPRSGRRR